MVRRRQIGAVMRAALLALGIFYFLAAGEGSFLHHHHHEVGETPDQCPTCIAYANASSAITVTPAAVVAAPEVVSYLPTSVLPQVISTPLLEVDCRGPPVVL